MEKVKAYLAAPFFKEDELEVYHKVISFLREVEKYDLYVPMEHTIPNAWDMSNAEWAKAVFDEDVKAIDEAEIVFVINFGMYSDSGTAWEAGYAFAKGKFVINIVKDTSATYSLMMLNGCDGVKYATHLMGNYIKMNEFEQK